MKKTFFLGSLATLLFITACGTPETESTEDNESVQEEIEKKETVNMMGGDEYEEPKFGDYEGQYVFDLENATDNIMDFALDDEFDVYIMSDSDAYKKIATYSGEATNERGVYSFEKDGYEESLRFILVEDQESEKYLAVAGEQVNGTDEALNPSQLWRVTTDTMEQTNTQVGMEALGGKYEPNTRHQGISFIDLKFQNETPTELNIKTEGVLNVQSDGGSIAEDYFVEPSEFKLTIDHGDENSEVNNVESDIKINDYFSAEEYSPEESENIQDLALKAAKEKQDGTFDYDEYYSDSEFNDVVLNALEFFSNEEKMRMMDESFEKLDDESLSSEDIEDILIPVKEEFNNLYNQLSDDELNKKVPEHLKPYHENYKKGAKIFSNTFDSFVDFASDNKIEDVNEELENKMNKIIDDNMMIADQYFTKGGEQLDEIRQVYQDNGIDVESQ